MSHSTERDDRPAPAAESAGLPHLFRVFRAHETRVLGRSAKFALVAAMGMCAVFPTLALRAESGTARIEDGNIAATPDAYRLGVSDKVRIQVFEWRPARDELFTWTALNQEYAVDPSGSLYLPLIGQVAASGYTTAELGMLISHKLANQLNLGAVPHTTVEVTKFRPIFVTGHVEKSGEYPFSPGMTVLQSISLSGGLYKGGGASGLRLEREFLTVAGEYDRLMQERERLIVRKARLEAELAFADRIAFPADLRMTRRPYKVEFTASLMAKEQNVFELRNKAYETQVTALTQLQNFLDNETETLGKRLESHQKQIDLMNAELGGIKHLTDKGLATQPRLLGMQRNLAQLEGEKLRIESERTRIQQEISRVVLSKIELDNRRANDLTIELQQTEARLEQVVQEAAVSEKLLIETRAQAATSPLRFVASTGEGAGRDGKPEIAYTIVRQVKDGVIELDGTEATRLQPGDTIKVSMTMPDTEFMGGFGLETRDGGTPAGAEAPSTTIEHPKAPHQASIEKISTGAQPR